jgi:hypothetical protein
MQVLLTVLAALAQALPTLLEIWQKWQDNAPARKKENDYAAFDKALAGGDAVELGRLFDELDSLRE